MNFFLTVIYGYIFVAGLVIFLITRDRKKFGLFFNRRPRLASIITAILFFGILVGIYSTAVEPFILKTTNITLQSDKIQSPIKIAFVSDMQVGQWKKTAWVEKIVKKIIAGDPDIIIIGGDLIDNEGTFEDESKYLEPLENLTSRYPVYYVLGNHEYGIGGHTINKPDKYTGDRSQLLINRMRGLGATLLRNDIVCPGINNQKICLFGIDDIWKTKPNFSELNNWNENDPLIFITHNPDGILSYPANFPSPVLTLAGHTHGGQVWIPLWGSPVGAQMILDESYYRGMNYFNGSAIYTSVGAGESGGAPLRLFAVPEAVIIELKP